MEAPALVVGAFYGSYFGEIDPFGHPAFRAVGKRRGFHKSRSNAELPAVHTEPAVLHGLFLLRKALHPPFYCRQDPVLVFSHTKQLLLL
jgi:hypothetical protein